MPRNPTLCLLPCHATPLALYPQSGYQLYLLRYTCFFTNDGSLSPPWLCLRAYLRRCRDTISWVVDLHSSSTHTHIKRLYVYSIFRHKHRLSYSMYSMYVQKAVLTSTRIVYRRNAVLTRGAPTSPPRPWSRGISHSLILSLSRGISPDQPRFSRASQVFFDIEIDGKAEGRILMQLRSDVVPKTAENFRQVFYIILYI